MEYHWINPDADQTLQRGLDENADDKQCAIACIRVDEAGLAEFYELFHPERYSYKKNSPCCEFQYPVKEHLVELSFRMNEAGLSKMRTDWLRQLKERLDSGEWLTHTPEGEPEGILTGVFVDQTRRIGLVYQQPGDDQYFQIFLNPDGTKADAFWSSRKNSEPEVYSEDEMSAIEQHIKNTFGEFENVFHELVSPDIHVDICIVPPTEERDYYTLVTMGMGAHRMNVPEELAEYKLERAELAIALPPDWKLDEESLKDERWYWPIGLLKVLARLPISNDTWLGFGHTMDKQSPFAEDTELCAALLVGPQDVVWNGGEVCTLPSGEEVNFYQVIPLYRNEMEYKMEHDADALLKKMAGISFVVNPTRQNAITRGTLAEEEFTGDMDDAAWHLESIQEKGLPVNEINAYNHMAIYLRWCIEHDLMSAEFMERYWEQVQPFMADLSRADLRGFIRDQLKGQLFGALFNKEGAAFAGYYYGEADSPYFPSDIDNYALEYTVTTCNVKGERVTIKKDKAKNKSSLRTYPLIPFLKERLLEAKKQQEENRKLCGRAYNKEYLGYVCVDVIGNLIKPNYVSSTFGKLLAKNNLRHIRFHDLRHTCASLLLANGVPMEQVKEWLGHSEISTTVDIYGHLQYATKKQSAAAIEQDIVAPMLQNLSAVSP